ncbi:MAG: TRAP transporter fused permease subunit [SAR324 cluster bacterium]|nr:TRAP transporter fused permease subunit [SAR324 cluster bacterium]
MDANRGYLLMLASMVCIGYWIMNFEVINYRTGAETDLDMAIAMVGVLIGIELARRVVVNVFVILGILMLLYGVYGYLAPNLISHAGATFPELCTSIFYKSDGVFGIMANVLATYVLLFVLFGAFLEKCGAQRFFIDFLLAAVGHKTGGPAKVSVIASGLFGSISGSAIANTVSTGAFTIPMMKKAGFKPHIAGGIEPAASIGGMFMPPIMGAGGFIMAELTGVLYSKIMLVALFPALMYFFSVFLMVHYYAKKEKIVGERYPKTAWEIVRSEWIYTMPLVVITALMLSGFSPGYSAVIGLATCVAVSFKEPHTRIDPTLAFIMGGFILALVMTFLAESAEQYTFISMEFLTQLKSWFSGWIPFIVGLAATAVFWFYRKPDSGTVRKELSMFLEAARVGTESSLKIGATVAVFGIIIGVLTFSGLVLTFADIVIELAEGSLVLTILLIALASLVLGMGVPVTAAYLITAVVAVPALIHLGVNEIAAHMIVYWLSQDSNITPPVCIAAFAGATIAKAIMWRMAISSFMFAKFLYLAPFIFGFVPGFTLQGDLWDIVKVFVLVLFATWGYSWVLSGIWISPLKNLFSASR